MEGCKWSDLPAGGDLLHADVEAWIAEELNSLTRSRAAGDLLAVPPALVRLHCVFV